MTDKEKLDGMKDQVTGKVQETAGKVTGDHETEAKGKAKGFMGEANDVMDDIKEKMDKDDK